MCPRARGVDQLSQEIQAPVRVPAVLISSAGRLGTGSEGPWGRAAFPGDSVLCPRARGVDQLSRAIPARV